MSVPVLFAIKLGKQLGVIGMSFLKNKQEHLKIVCDLSSEDAIEFCKVAFDYLNNGPNYQRYELLAKKYATDLTVVQNSVEALISILIDATRSNASEGEIAKLQQEGFSEKITKLLSQFIASNREFIEGSIESAFIRSYRLVNLEWRLEVRIASRSLLQQCNILVVMKMYLHTEPKKENRDLIQLSSREPTDINDKINRKDLLIQTDLNSLKHIIHVLEDALFESKSRRIRNIVESIQSKNH